MADVRLQSTPALDLVETGELLDNLPGGGYVCPICKNDSWTAWFDDTGLVTGVPWTSQEGQPTGEALTVITFTCDKCGYARQHLLETFRKFLEGLKHAH